MLLIYTPQSTTRLQCICKFIFEEILQTNYSITRDEINFNIHDGNKINYSEKLFENCFQIKPHTLLLETIIKAQTLECFDTNNVKAFFKTSNDYFSFDIFSATFYLITRYEEYLPHTKDKYGRYAHENSVAFKEIFLYIPIVNIWINNFAIQLKNRFSTIHFQPPTFNYLPTYDIDMAWSYKEKVL